MSISYVNKGDKITADLFNDVIDAANKGQVDVGSLNFQKIDTGGGVIITDIPKDYINNTDDLETHDWEVNEWQTAINNSNAKLIVRNPLCWIGSTEYTAVQDRDLESVYGDWYCGARKDLVGEEVKPSDQQRIVEEEPAIFTNDITTSESVEPTDPTYYKKFYVWKKVFSIYEPTTAGLPNGIVYHNISPTFCGGGGGGSGGNWYMPFDYVKEKVQDSESYTYKIIRNRFYFDAEYQEIDDYTIQSTDGTVTIYLKCDHSTTNPEYSIVEEEVQGDKIQCYKLYDLNTWDVTCDYRNTFLTVYSKGGAESEVDVDDISIDWLEPESGSGDPEKLEIWHFKAPQTSDKDVYEIPDSPPSSPESQSETPIEPEYRFLARYESNGSYGLRYVDIFKKGGGGGGGGNSFPGANEPILNQAGEVTGITNVMVQWERRWITKGSDVSLTPSEGETYVVMTVNHPQANANPTYPQPNDISISTENNPFDVLNNDDTLTKIPLFKLNSKKVVIDYRNVPCIPVWR